MRHCGRGRSTRARHHGTYRRRLRVVSSTAPVKLSLGNANAGQTVASGDILTASGGSPSNRQLCWGLLAEIQAGRSEPGRKGVYASAWLAASCKRPALIRIVRRWSTKAKRHYCRPTRFDHLGLIHPRKAPGHLYEHSARLPLHIHPTFCVRRFIAVVSSGDFQESRTRWPGAEPTRSRNRLVGDSRWQGQSDAPRES
jgi:hypothetical protein